MAHTVDSKSPRELYSKIIVQKDVIRVFSLCVSHLTARVIKQVLADTKYFSTVFFYRLGGLGTGYR